MGRRRADELGGAGGIEPGTTGTRSQPLTENTRRLFPSPIPGAPPCPTVWAPGGPKLARLRSTTTLQLLDAVNSTMRFSPERLTKTFPLASTAIPETPPRAGPMRDEVPRVVELRDAVVAWVADEDVPVAIDGNAYEVSELPVPAATTIPLGALE